MGLRHIQQLIEANARMIVNQATWGHLFPKGRYFEGKVRIALGAYGSIIILDEQIDTESSPWWFDALSKFAGELSEDMESGEVREVAISVTIVEHEFFYSVEEGEIEADDPDVGKPYKIECEFVIQNLKSDLIVQAW